MEYSVYLSPSTQERNVGVSGYGTEEKRMNEIADIIKKVLQKHRLKVYRNNPRWDLRRVVEDSNLKKPDLHLAIHSNAGGGSGCEIFVYSAGSKGEKVAKVIYQEIEQITPTKDRGIKYNPALYELKKTNAPAVLVEIGFHDNERDAVWIIDNIEKIGTTIASGIIKYFEINYPLPAATTTYENG
jgi:N-acetylmuramoyl-L-alanine amidase